MPFLLLDSRLKASLKRYTQWACAIAFCVYSFVYVYCYQGDLLAMAQHVLAEGKTHYRHFLSAALITAMLFALQRVVARVARVDDRWHAVTYFPSLLALTVLTDVSPNIDRGSSLGAWGIVAPLLIGAFVAIVGALRRGGMGREAQTDSRLFSAVVWGNLMAMAAMFVLVCLCSNSDEVFHYRMRMERLIGEGKYSEALKVGRRSLATDESLAMLRAHALAHEGLLGERLFCYPIPQDGVASDDDAKAGEWLLPDGDRVRTMMLPDSVVVALAKSGGVRTHYKLSRLLLERNLKDFAMLLEKVYPDSVPLPRHYAEALMAYRFYGGKPIAGDFDNALEEDFRGFREMEKDSPKDTAHNFLRRTYGNTYWYYYRYPRH